MKFRWIGKTNSAHRFRAFVMITFKLVIDYGRQTRTIRWPSWNQPAIIGSFVSVRIFHFCLHCHRWNRMSKHKIISQPSLEWWPWIRFDLPIVLLVGSSSSISASTARVTAIWNRVAQRVWLFQLSGSFTWLNSIFESLAPSMQGTVHVRHARLDWKTHQRRCGLYHATSLCSLETSSIDIIGTLDQSHPTWTDPCEILFLFRIRVTLQRRRPLIQPWLNLVIFSFASLVVTSVNLI